jgi:hypothetical protein
MRARKHTWHSWRMVVPSQRRSCVQRTAQCLRSADLGHREARAGVAWDRADIACVAMDSHGRCRAP